MIRLNLMLLAAVMASAFYLVHTQYESRRLYTAIDKAIELKSDYPEALTYKGLLLRVQATLEKNPTRQQELVKEAATFSAKATEVQAKQRAAGAGE